MTEYIYCEELHCKLSIEACRQRKKVSMFHGMTSKYPSLLACQKCKKIKNIKEIKMSDGGKIIICKVCGEKKPHKARGMCKACYDKWWHENKNSLHNNRGILNNSPGEEKDNLPEKNHISEDNHIKNISDPRPLPLISPSYENSKRPIARFSPPKIKTSIESTNVIFLDFSQYPEFYKLLQITAKASFRTIEQQAMYYISIGCGKNEEKTFEKIEK